MTLSTLTKKVLAILGSLTVISLFTVSIWAPKVQATITGFTPNNCYTSSATTTATLISNGVATSTLSCNLGGGGADSATLLVNFAASSTAVTLRADVEYSQNGVDWYADTLSTTTTGVLNQSLYYTWLFASSTVGHVSKANTPKCFAGQVARGDCDTRAVNIPTPAAYVRVVFTATGGAATIWAQILPKQSIN